MKLTLLDTQTGEQKEIETYEDPWCWSEGNWSCDCNRTLYFEAHPNDSGCCIGSKRFIITKADTTEYTLRELNQDYPEALLKEHGIV